MHFLDGSQVVPGVFQNIHFQSKNASFGWFPGDSQCFRLLCIGDVIRHYMDPK